MSQDASADRQEEVITMVGGPHDGAKFGWRGGDVATFVMSPPSDLFGRAWLSVPARPQEILYRRSLTTREIFVFQP